MPTTITLPTELTNGSTADASEVMGDLNAIVTRWNNDVGALSGDVVSTTEEQTLTLKTLTTPVIAGIYQDAAKTKLHALPDTASDTLAAISATQTLTNKTITKPTIQASIQAMATAADGATVTFDLSASNIHTVTLGGNRTLALSNVSTGQAFVIRLVQDATGSRTVTWFSTIKWPNAVVPTLTTTANKTDVFGFICTGSGTYDGFIAGQAL